MIINGKDVSDEEFFNRIVPIDNNFKKYMVSFIIPEAIAFYLKDCFYKDCLCDSPIYNHINSTFDMKCCYQESIDDMIPKIKEILLIKYNLKIKNDNPLILKKIISISEKTNAYFIKIIVLANPELVLPTNSIWEKTKPSKI